MPRISTSTIDEVNARTDFVALVNEYVRLTQRGSNWWACCPFHNEKTPSFSIVPERNMYHCFGCGVGGSLINFYMEMEKVTFMEAVIALARRSGIEIIYEDGQAPIVPIDNTKDLILDLYKRTAHMFRYVLVSTEQGTQAQEYLKKRGIDDKTSEKFMLGFSPKDRYGLKKFLREKNFSDDFLAKSGLFSKNYPDVAFFSNRLMFPICDRKGQVVAFGGRILEGEGPKYINSVEMPHYKKGETLYAFHMAKNAIREQKSVILCEGYMDVIAYHQAGICNAAAPLGTALTEEQIKVIKPFADTVYLSFDSDEAGQKATYKAILMCRKADITVKIIRMSEGAKDPAEILLNFGSSHLKKIVECAIIDCDYLLSAMSSQYRIDTPEGKTKAALAFFPYVDALNSDMQKESSLERLAQEYSLKLEAVKADFKNRDSAQKRTEFVRSTKPDKSIKLNAELVAMLAVAANSDFFNIVRSRLLPEDFEDVRAKNIYILLEECFREDALRYDTIMERCSDEQIRKLIAQTVTSGEFSENTLKTIEDCIRTIKRKSLKRKKDTLLNKIRRLSGATLLEVQQINAMQGEVEVINTELAQYKGS